MSAFIEKEYKFIAEESDVVQSIGGWLRSSGVEVMGESGVTQLDTYFDSGHKDLTRHGVALRLRQIGRDSQLHFKGMPEIEDDLCLRREVEVAFQGKVTTPSQLPSVIRNEVEPLAFGRRLAPVISLSTHRKKFLLRGLAGSGPPAELVVDTVSVAEPVNRGVNFTEVELEIPDVSGSWQHLARRLRTELPLQPSRESKLERALHFIGLDTQAPHWDEPSRKMPIYTAAIQVLTRHFSSAQLHEPGTREGSAMESLHKMRVAYRRLSVACRTFDRLFAPNLFESAKEMLRESRAVMGPVRDIDVFCEWLTSTEDTLPAFARGGVPAVSERLRDLRAQRREKLLEWLTSPKRLRSCEAFEDLLDALGTHENGRSTVQDVAPGYVLNATRTVFKRARHAEAEPDPERLHRLRIAMKRLRYTSEEFVNLYEGLDDIRKRLADLQDALGEYCDADNSIALLIQLGAAHGSLSHEAQATVQTLIGLNFSRRDQALRTFQKAWEHLSRKRLSRDLVRVFV